MRIERMKNFDVIRSKYQVAWVIGGLVVGLLATGCGVVAVDPTPTLPAPTATPTPTVTPEPTPTVTATIEAVSVSTPTPLNLPPLSPLALAPEDFPVGFERVNPLDYGFDPEDLSFQQFSVDEVFAYVHPEAEQAVVGLRVNLDTWAEDLGWQLVVANPQVLVEVFLPQADVQASQPAPLSGLDGIGEHAGGFAMTAQSQGIAASVEVVIFDREGIGAMLISLYPDGRIPVISTDELAGRWDGRILSALNP
jgi:hypothetical protein